MVGKDNEVRGLETYLSLEIFICVIHFLESPVFWAV